MQPELKFIRTVGFFVGGLALAAMLAVVALSVPADQGTALSLAMLFPLLAIVWFLFWFVQLIDLMGSRADRFPAPHDKLIWAAIFILLAPLAPLLFWVWKRPSNPAA